MAAAESRHFARGADFAGGLDLDGDGFAGGQVDGFEHVLGGGEHGFALLGPVPVVDEELVVQVHAPRPHGREAEAVRARCLGRQGGFDFEGEGRQQLHWGGVPQPQVGADFVLDDGGLALESVAAVVLKADALLAVGRGAVGRRQR